MVAVIVPLMVVVLVPFVVIVVVRGRRAWNFEVGVGGRRGRCRPRVTAL